METEKAPLEDLMVAMDVVDTIRHQEKLVTRELDAEGRRENMLERLKQIYQAQGIEVSEQVLRDGILAMEEERFRYIPVTGDWRLRLARLWVSRSRWGRPLSFMAVLAVILYAIYFVVDVMPERQLQSKLPQMLSSTVAKIEASASDPMIVEQSKEISNGIRTDIDRGRYEEAQAQLTELESLADLLRVRYQVRVVSRPGEQSGIFRIPDANQKQRNYYLIVEAIDRDNKVVALDILDEETNQRRTVKTWGLRVNKETFSRVASDKGDDGIIQQNIVGEKPIGVLRPKFKVATTGATILKW